MSRKHAVLIMAVAAMASLLWADTISAQAQCEKVGRPWEVDGVAAPYLDEGFASDRGEGIIESNGHLRSRDILNPESDSPVRTVTTPRTATGMSMRHTTSWILKWWFNVAGIFHL